MPIDPEVAKAQAEQAQKEVRFDRAAYEKSLPRADKNPADTKLRRQSANAARMPVVDDTAQATVTIDEGDETEVTVEITSDRIRELLDEAVAQCRFDGSAESLNDDLQAKLQHYAAYYGRKEGPCFPFATLTEEGKENITHNGLVNKASFNEMCRQTPDALFSEIKVRALMNVAYERQVHELLKITRNMTTAMDTMRKWVHFALDRAEKGSTAGLRFSRGTVPRTAPSEASDSSTVGNLMQTINDLNDTVIQKDNEIAELNSTIVHLATTARGTTPASAVHSSHSAVSASSASHKKTTKLTDPPVWYDDKTGGKDQVDFEVWYRMMENKLAVNHDHFETELSKTAYIQSRVGGKASSDLMPYCRRDHPDQLTTAAKMMDHLWKQYDNPSRREDARKAYNKLVYKPSDDFAKFKNDFVRLAGELKKPRSEWKEEFNSKLTPTLQTSLVSQFADDNLSFEEYSTYALRISNILKHAQQERAASSAASTTSSSRRSGRSQGSSSGGRSSASSFARPSIPKRSPEEIRRLATEGRCFICEDKGHVSRECPGKAQADREKAVRISNIDHIIATFATKDDESDDSQGKA